MSATNPLGSFLLTQAYSRVLNRSAQIEKVDIGPGTIVEMLKGRLMSVFSLGSKTLQDDYYGSLNLTLTGVSSGVAQVVGRTFSSIQSVFAVREVTALLSEKYNPAESMAAMSGYVKDYAHLSDGRHWFFAKNDNSIYIMQGKNVAGTENAITSWIVGYPDTNWTYDDVKAGTKRIDCPDWIYPWVTLGAAVDALYEVSAQMDNAQGAQLMKDYDNVVQSIDGMIKAESQELRGRGATK